MRTIFLLALVSVPLLSGCLSSSPKATPGESVRRVDIRETPGLKELAERVRRVGNEVYPQIVGMLSDVSPKPPRQFDIVFKQSLTNGNLGMGGSSSIWLNGEYFTRRPDMLESVLVHELVHVAQCYDRTAPSHWVEGLADSVRIKLGYTNGTVCAGCSTSYPHFTSGYECTASFLLYLEGRFGPEIIRKLDAVLRNGRYTDVFFRRETGQDLEALWSGFQKTSAFSAEAGELLKVHETLGFVDGRPPADFAARLQKYPGGIVCLHAAKFLRSVAEQHKLPGFVKGEHGQLNMGINSMTELEAPDSESFPRSRTAWAKKRGDMSTYHYIVVQSAKDGPWTISKAWATDAHGRMTEEFQVE